MKIPFQVPMSVLCAECGRAMQQNRVIQVQPVPHVVMQCGNTECNQFDKHFAVKLQNVELVEGTAPV